MNYRAYAKLTEGQVVACHRCGCGLVKHAVVAELDGAFVHLGMDCAGTLGVSPQTAKQRAALPAAQAKALWRAELAAGVEYRNAQLAERGRTVADIPRGVLCSEDALLPVEGGRAWNGAQLRRVVDRWFPVWFS